MKKLNLASVFLASGYSKRFHTNKLLYPISGTTMIERIFSIFPFELFIQNIVVTNKPEIAVQAALSGLTVVENLEGKCLSDTIRLGLQVLKPEIDGCIFCVCDQPFLTTESILSLVTRFRENPNHIVALGFKQKRGNPVVFPKEYFHELSLLTGDNGGSSVINSHKDSLILVECAEELELCDIDHRSDLVLYNLDAIAEKW